MKAKPAPSPEAAAGKSAPRTPIRTPTRTPRGELRRESLLKAAHEVFLESGFHGASIEEVVRRVGGSKASLYSYFGSKEGLFTDIIVAQCDAFMKKLSLPDGVDPDIEKTLTEVSHSFLKMFLDPNRRELFRIIVAEASRFPEFAKRFYESGPLRSRRLLGNYLRLQHEAGIVNCPDPEFAASMFVEMVKATPHHRTLLGLSPYHQGHDIDSHVAGAVRMFLHGVALPVEVAPTKKSRKTG